MDNKVQINSNQKRLKIAIIILAVLMILSAGGLAARYIYLYIFAPTQTTVTVPDNLIGEEMEIRTQDTIAKAEAEDFYASVGDGAAAAPAGALNVNGGVAGSLSSSRTVAAKLELYQGRPDVNQKFAVSNMLPGDYVTKYYCVRVSHDAGVDLFFRTEVTEETKNLGDVLHIRVTRLGTDEVLCDAPFSEVDGQEFSERLAQNAGSETTIYYRIDAYLDTSVGNEYQAALLKADFEWYVEDVSCLIPPKTGDPINIILWTVLALSSLMLIVLLVLLRRRKNEDGIDKNISKPRTKTRKKVISSIVVIVALLSMLVVTTYALFSSFVSVDDNLFQTGTVQIELNGGKPIFDGSDMNIEPGHTLVRNFTVENKGSAEVYVRLYLENVQGDLQDVLTFSIYDGDTLLFRGSADEWTREASCISDTPLGVGEIRTLTAIVKMDESATNSYQMAGITFDMTADAVQSKNNPDKSFE